MHRHKVGFYAADREDTDIGGREQAFLVPLHCGGGGADALAAAG
jgi:hypothetical protein